MVNEGSVSSENPDSHDESPPSHFLEKTSSNKIEWLKLTSFKPTPKQQAAPKTLLIDEDDGSEDEYIELDPDLLLGEVKKMVDKMKFPKNAEDQQKLLRKSRRLKRKAVVELSKKRPIFVDSGASNTPLQLKFKVDLKGEYLTMKNRKDLVPFFTRVLPTSSYLSLQLTDNVFDNCDRFYKSEIPADFITIFPDENSTLHTALFSDLILIDSNVLGEHVPNCSLVGTRQSNTGQFYSLTSIMKEVADVNSCLDTDPHNIEMWLKLMELHRLKLPEDVPLDLITKSQQAVLEKALQKNPNSYELLLKSIDLFSCKQNVTTDEIDNKWINITFQYPNNIGIWCKYIEHLMINFSKSNVKRFSIQINRIINKLKDIQSPYVPSKQRVTPMDGSNFYLKIICYFSSFLSISGHSEKLSTLMQLLIIYNLTKILLDQHLTVPLESYHNAFVKYYSTYSSKLGDTRFTINNILKFIFTELNQTNDFVDDLLKKLPTGFNVQHRVITDSISFIENFLRTAKSHETTIEDSILKSSVGERQKWLQLDSFRSSLYFYPLNIRNKDDNFVDSSEDPDSATNEKLFFPTLVLFQDVSMIYELIYLYFFLIECPIKSSYIPVCYPILESLSLIDEASMILQFVNSRYCDGDVVVRLRKNEFSMVTLCFDQSPIFKSFITQTIIRQVLEINIFPSVEFCKIVSIWILFLVSDVSERRVLPFFHFGNLDAFRNNYGIVSSFLKKCLSISHCRNSNLLWVFYCIIHSIAKPPDTTLHLIDSLVGLQLNIVSQYPTGTESFSNPFFKDELINLVTLIRLYGDILFELYGSHISLVLGIDIHWPTIFTVGACDSFHNMLVKLLAILKCCDEKYVSVDHDLQSSINLAMQCQDKYTCDLLILNYYQSVITKTHSNDMRCLSGLKTYMQSVQVLLDIVCNNDKYCYDKYVCLLRFISLIDPYISYMSNHLLAKEIYALSLKVVEYFPTYYYSLQHLNLPVLSKCFKSLETRVFLNKLFSKPFNSTIRKYNLWNIMTSFEVIKFYEQLNLMSLAETQNETCIPISCSSRCSQSYRLRSLVEMAISDSETSLRLMPVVWEKCLHISSIISDPKYFESVVYRALQNCGWDRRIYTNTIYHSESFSIEFIENLMSEHSIRVRLMLEEFKFLLNEANT